ncbi:MAG TPA: carbohydrate-binding protein [Fibrobacteraceae bacterium]|nr:carbohydrate-binding protein [Fibrobacteraceae bacterium]
MGYGNILKWGAAALFVAASLADAITINDTPMGFASTNGGTTGGSGGTVVVVSTISDLVSYAAKSGSYIIYVSGTMGTDVTGTTDDDGGDMSVVTVKGDKTIFGLPGSKLIGRILIKDVSNVIIRNMTIQGPGAVDVDGVDAMTIQTSTNVWIDHCDIYDGQDGNLDIVNQSTYITVSWTKFHYTSNSVAYGESKAHRYCNLICGTKKSSDAGYYLVTMQYNWWADGVTERMPRVRYGKVDVVNNLVTSEDNNYAVRAGLNANILVEANAFIGTNNPVDIYDEESGQVITVKDNLFTSCSGTSSGSGTAFTRSDYYDLDILSASKVQDTVQNSTYGAGATLCNLYTNTTCGTVVSSSSTQSSSSKISSSSAVSSSSKVSSSSVVVSSSSFSTVLVAIQGEDFCAADSGWVETKNTGYLGEGYLNVDNDVDQTAVWAVSASSAGTVQMVVRYANGGTADRPVSIAVNGTTQISSFSFPVTDDWTTWALVETSLNLAEGWNEIVFTSLTSEGPANIDQLGFDANTVSATDCEETISSSSAAQSSSSEGTEAIQSIRSSWPSRESLPTFDLLGRFKGSRLLQ